MVMAVLSAANAAPATASNGGTYASLPPTASSVTCRTACTSLTTARPGSTVRIVGGRLDEVTQVVFLGARGPADDVSAPAAPARGSSAVEATVPAGARSGSVALVDAGGKSSKPTRRALRIAATLGNGVLAARVDSRRVVFDGRRPATLELFPGVDGQAGLAIDLVREPVGTVVAHWELGSIPAGAVQSIAWNGKVAGRPAREGRYEFHVAALGLGARAAQSPPVATGFQYLGHVFPVRGAHSYGDGFGAPRSGHTHQGVDVMANCGTPLVAARGGVVKYRASQAAAGNYLVIDGKDSGLDDAYMHLREPSPLRKGDRVLTGQRIGYVGRTGDATACHLHFEEWSAPGWYTGGHAIDPLADLRAWDAVS